MYRFRELDISGVGPFGKGNAIRFGTGVTYICAGNGLGKTTIVRALRGHIPEARPEQIGHPNPSVPDWVIFFDEAVRLPYGGERWSPLTDLVATGIVPNLDWRQLENATAIGIRELLEHKVPLSKFSGAISSSQEINLKLEKDGTINVVDSTSGRSLNWGFEARGERTVLYLAINRAIRTQAPDVLDVPFVIDSCLGGLDMGILKTAMTFIKGMPTQVILLENCVMNSRLGTKANYEILGETDSGKSKIVPRL